jgi:hypothetical protein
MECGGGATDSGTGGSAGGDGVCKLPSIVDQTCSAFTNDDKCLECQFVECCASVDSVFNEPGVTKNLADCWFDCADDDDQCRDDCFDQYPEGINGFAGYEVCVGINCRKPDACTGGACSSCQYENCGCDMANCLMDPACYRSFKCLGTCAANDAACAAACPDKYPEGKQLYQRLQTCSTQNCTSVCAGL